MKGEWDLNGFGRVLNMTPHWDSNQGQKTKSKKKMQANINHTDSNRLLTHMHTLKYPCRLINPDKPTHVTDPFENAATQTPSDAQIYKNKCLYNTEIKFMVHLAI